MQRSGEFVVYREVTRPDDGSCDVPVDIEYMTDIMRSNGTQRTKLLADATRFGKTAAFDAALYMTKHNPKDTWSVAEVVATPKGVSIDR